MITYIVTVHTSGRYISWEGTYARMLLTSEWYGNTSKLAMQVLGILVLKRKGGPLYMLYVRFTYICCVEKTTRTLQSVRGLYAVYSFKNSRTQLRNWFSCTLQDNTKINKSSVCVGLRRRRDLWLYPARGNLRAPQGQIEYRSRIEN